MSKKTINVRAKGHAYERKIVSELKELGYVNAVTSRSESKRADDDGVDILGVDGFAIQCKAVERLGSVLSVLEHINTKYGMPVLFHKRNRRREVVSMFKEDFYKLIKSNNDTKNS